VIVGTPNNPTGRVFSANELRAVADVCVDHDLYCIADEVYEKIVYDDHKHLSIAALPGMSQRTITCNSFSKTYSMSGYRVGYAAAPKELTAKIRQFHYTMVLSASAVSQVAALAALDAPREYVEQMRKDYEERRAIVAEQLQSTSAVSFKLPEGAYFFYLDIETRGVPISEVAKRLLYENGVATVPGSDFETRGTSRLRLCFARKKSILYAGLERISNFLRDHFS